MKKANYLIAFFAAIIVTSCGGDVKNPAEISEALEPGEKPENAIEKSIDAKKSTVAWEGDKVVGSPHDGTINVKSGELYIVDDYLVGGRVVIDMNTIVVLDIENPASNARLKSHLESDDFFSVETFPEAYFDMARIERIADAKEDEPNYIVKGNLTIKGITHGFSFPAHVSLKDDKLHAKADFSFDRTLYDVRFGSGKFFDNLGDNMIKDHINMGLNIVAK